MDFGFATVPAITVIAYIVGMGAKAATFIPDKNIPLICGVVGGIIGIIAMYVMPGYPADNIITAVAVGAVSGLAATGVDQIKKQSVK